MPPVTIEDYCSENEAEDSDDDTISTASEIDNGDDSDSDYEPSSDEEDDEVDNFADDFPPVVDDIIVEEAVFEGQHEVTARLRRLLGNNSELAAKIVDVLRYMASKGLDIAIFLDALSWGTEECASDRTIAQARSVLMNSLELPGILQRWYEPPRPSGSTNIRPRGAKEAIQNVAHQCVSELVEKELVALANIVRNESTMMTESEVTSIHIETITNEMQSAAPILWSLLEKIAQSKSQKKRNTKKTPEKIITIVLSMLLYSRNQHCNILQKIFGMYFKFRQLAIRGFDVLHSLGITMSSSWATKNLSAIADENMETISKYIKKLLVVLTYDNINIHRKVFEQRVNHQTHFDSGAAATGFVKPNEPRLSPEQVAAIKDAKAKGMDNPLDCFDIYELEASASNTLHPHIVHRILKALLDSPEFDFATYKHKDSALLSEPAAVHPLPHGPDHTALQFLLRTVELEEASYDGNDRCVNEWLRQLKLDSREDRKKLGTEMMIPIVGDQLTVERLRGLYKFRAEDDNSFERSEHILEYFGWFHLEMVVAVSLHKQYYGTNTSRGLLSDFTLLNKKGISKPITKGPFHHHLDEALHHRLEAHLRYAWLSTTGVNELKNLRRRTPAKLLEFAEKIYKEHASSLALDEMSRKPKLEVDELRRQSIMWNRDCLHYVTLVRAIKTGDVGIMEAMLPHLLFRFVGGGHKKYSGEIIELLQALNRELPEDVRDIVREHFWLVNFQGHWDTFLPLDQAQEHNIKGIKGLDGGPHGGFGYLNKLTPALRSILQVNGHVEGEFGVLSRGKKHSKPDKEPDLAKLIASYHQARIYAHKNNHTFSKGTTAKDFVHTGMLALQKNKFFTKWNEKRAFPRSTDELSESESDDDEF